MSGHTPTPWSLGGKATIKATGPHGGPAYIATMENNCERGANAAFIVRAVNSHDDLVAALNAHDAYMLDAGYEGPESSALHPKAAANWRNVRAALAKAAQS